MSLAREEEEAASTHSQRLAEETARCAGHGVDPALFERALLASARDFLSRPGKGFRARLLEGVYLVAGGARAALPRASLEAIELLHAGSLIVDDIEDDSEQRRGAPSLHRLIGVPRALNTGNWLYFVALSKLHDLELPLASERELTRAAHVCLMRCHEGQALDLSMRVSELRRSDVHAVAETTARLKTGALTGFAARLGALVAGADAEDVAALERFGEQVGLALQRLDDLTSFLCDERAEKAYEDLRAERVNFMWALAADALDEVTYKHWAREARRFDLHESLRQRLRDGVAARGRREVRLQLDAALLGARGHFGDNPALELISLELTRLEKSYG